MDCQAIADLMPDYVQSSLSPADADTVETHLRECLACREEAELWNQLADLPATEPGPASRARFQSMLAAYKEGMRQSSSGPPRGWLSGSRLPGFAQLAAVIALMMLAFIAGMVLPRATSNEKEVALLRRELADTQQLVAMSLLQHPLASDRLQGVSWSTRIERPEPEVIDGLLDALRYDPSVNVRLAALDALRRHDNQEVVRAALRDALEQQKSPLVQIRLIDFLVESRDPSAVEQLRNLERSPDLLPTVRQHLQQGIKQLTRGSS